MCSSHSKSLLLISLFFFALLLIIFTMQISDNRSNEINIKGEVPLPLENPTPEWRDSTSHDRKDRFDVQPRWSHFLQPPKEVLPERRGKPENESIFWEEVQEDLKAIIEEKFPELKLSKRDLQRLIETIRTLQKSILELGETDRTRSNGEQIKQIRGEVRQALETFEEITQMSISDFILFGRPESGLDNEKPDDEDIVEEYLDHSKS